MRVVVVSPAVPHPFGETAARGLYVLVSGLAARGIEVACLVAGTESASRISEAREWLGRAEGGDKLRLDVFPLTVRPVALRKWRSLWRPFSEMLYARGLATALERQMASGYDVLHLEQLWSGWLGRGRPRTLLNVYQLEVVDWEQRRLGSWGERKALLQMRRATRRILRSARGVRVVTPFALDVSLSPLQPATDAPVVGLLGSMHWFPSRSAAERLITRIWPHVKRRVPNARLLVGRWNARRHLERLEGADVTVVGTTPHPPECA